MLGLKNRPRLSALLCALLLPAALAAAPGPLGDAPHRSLWAAPMTPPAPTMPANGVVQASGIADPLSEPDAKVLHGTFSPDGKRVAVAVERAGRRHLELRDWTGSVPPLQLTSGDGIDDFPCWTPDGEALVYQSTRGATTKLYMLPMASRREVPLTFGSGDDMHPRVSHSGRYIAFDSNRGGNSDIWLLDRDTGKLGQVTYDPSADFYPAWSPDDRALAFTSARSGKFEIWCQRLGKGRDATRITWGPGHQAHPDWSAGGWIAYDSDQMGQTKILMTQPAAAVRAAAMAAGGVPIDALAQAAGAVVTVSDGVSMEEFPRFSRAGRHLLIQATDSRFVSMRIRKSPIAVPAAALALAPGGAQMIAAARVPHAGLAVGGKNAFGKVQPQPETAQATPSGRRLIVHDGSNAPAFVPNQGTQVIPTQVAGPPIAGLPVGVGIGMPRPNPPQNADPLGVPIAFAQANAPRASDPLAVPSGFAPAPAVAPVPNATGDSFRVLEFFPTATPEGVPTDTPISVLFSRGLDRVMEPEKSIDLLDGTEKLPVVGSYNPELKRIDVVPRTPLLGGTDYTVVVRGVIRSQEGSPLGTDQTFRFRTAGKSSRKSNLSNAAFRTQTVVPGREQKSVSQQVKVEVTFTEKLDLTSMEPNTLRLTDESGRQVLGELYAPEGDTKLTLSPYKPLAEGATYKITIAGSLKSTSGAFVPAEERSWEFRTVSRKAFSVIGVAPLVLDGPRPRIRVRFTKPVDLRSVAKGRMTLEGGGMSFGGRVSNAENGEVLIFEPYQSLPGGQEFTVALPPGLTDDEGKELGDHKKLVVKTRPGKPTQLMSRSPDSPPIMGLGKAAGASAQAPKIMQKHGMPAQKPGAPPIVMQNFGAKQPAKAAPGAAPSAAWIYTGLRDLARRGYLGEDADAGKIGSSMTRYAVAQLVHRAARGFESMDLQDRQLVRKLQKEFATELTAQGMPNAPARM